MPSFYKTVTRVTWIVENIDRVRPAWTALGLTDIQEYPNIQLAGTFQGKPVTIYAWQITGHLGNLTVDMIQPAEGQINAYTNFLAKHGDGGIFAVVHEVPTKEAMAKEVLRMRGKGVAVLQQVTMPKQNATFTYFDTEPEGKFVLGLVYRPGGFKPSTGSPTVASLGPVVVDAQAVSAFWAKLGFPAFQAEHVTAREDTRYHDKSLSFAYNTGTQHYNQFRYDWTAPPPNPPNIYTDYLRSRHHEGIQHLGIQVEDLQKSVATYEKLGYHVLQSGTSSSGRYVFLDNDKPGGISLELIQSN